MSYSNIIETPLIAFEGHIKIFDVDSGEVLVKRRNAINFENMSIAIANLLANLAGSTSTYEIKTMKFGNGGTTVDGIGNVTYKVPNTGITTGALYNETFSQALDGSVTDNSMSVSHTAANLYSDIVITSTLDYGVPVGQDATDTATNQNGDYIFDELGLFTANGDMLTHVVFHPVQKSANRKIQVVYTLRVRTSYSNV